MWVHWMWGFMIGAFCLSFMGKWVRRSNVMTGAEWMVTRFGDDSGGKAARNAYALMAVITQAGMIGYAFQGIGKFASVYINLSPIVCSSLIIGFTTFYVILGGFYSVVITDVIQTVILTISGLIICWIAFHHISAESLDILPTGWESVRPVWHIPEFHDTAHAEYEWFGLLVIAWVMKGLLLNLGGPAQLYDFQRFLSARNERDASLIGASWSFFLVVRWGMAMSIVLIALVGIKEIDDPEKIMPIVLLEYLPAGLRGIVIAGLLAAFMSTFSSTVNSAASYIVKDFWQAIFYPQASEKQLINASYIATIAVVLVGFVIGLQTDSIAGIYNWLMMALGTAVVIPNVLRWYWRRFNGWGYAAGTIAGTLLSLVTLFQPGLPMYIMFPAIALTSLATSICATFLTAPVSDQVLQNFYNSVKPFGLWGTRNRDANRAKCGKYDSPMLAIINTMLSMVAIGSIYLCPMYLIGHWFWHAGFYFIIFALSAGALYFTWYRCLPDKCSKEILP